MKINNSKKQLAKIIHENGGWRGGAPFAVQSGLLGYVEFYASKPVCESFYWRAKDGVGYRFLSHTLLPNWPQTVLSRDEYLRLYPAAETAPGPVKVVVENKTTCCLTVSDKPTIEQLAADYRNRKDYADRKQQEADAAKADAEAKLAELVAAGMALGLALSVAGTEPEAIDDGWIEYTGNGCPVDGGEIVEVFLRKGRPSTDGPKAASRWDWSIDGVGSDIIKWRRVKEAENV